MSIIFSCAKAYEKLLDVEYQIILGKKNKQINFSIFFTANHFIHLAGFQHLKDKNTVLSGERDKIFEKILKDENYSNQFETSVFYSQIKERIEYLSFLESIMDSNKTIFKYNPQIQVFSAIQADFLLKNEIESINVFTFLAKDNTNGKYFCRSFFPQTNIDYSQRQASWTLLFKKKKNKKTKEEIILFNKINPNMVADSKKCYI